jgi:hypothetical protein
MQRYDPKVHPEGIIFNAQTHCIQIPRIYLGAHYARGGTAATEKLQALAEKLVPGTGGVMLGQAWQMMEDQRDTPMMRYYASKLRREAAQPQKPGPLAGLMMMPPEQYLTDVADNMDLRADIIELRIALDSGREVKKALRTLVGHLRPYRDRLGYNHIDWAGPLRKGVMDPLVARLNEKSINDAVFPPGNKHGPKGYMLSFIDAVEAYASS